MRKEENLLVWLTGKVNWMLDNEGEKLPNIIKDFMEAPMKEVGDERLVTINNDEELKDFIKEEMDDFWESYHKPPCVPYECMPLAIKVELNGERAVGEYLYASWGPTYEDMCSRKYYGLHTKPIVFGDDHWFISWANITGGIPTVRSPLADRRTLSEKINEIVEEATQEDWDNISRFGALPSYMFDITHTKNIGMTLKLLENSVILTNRFTSPITLLKLDAEKIKEKAFMSFLMQRYNEYMPYYEARKDMIRDAWLEKSDVPFERYSF